MEPVGHTVEQASHSSTVWPDAYLDKQIVSGDYRIGIQLPSIWNATLTDCTVSGPLGDEAEYERPTVMEIGIDVGASMDCHIIRPRIMACKTGIFAGAPDTDGRAEGLHVEGGWMQHVNIGVELFGEYGGGWQTPASWIERMHLNHLQQAIRVFWCAGVHIVHNDLYASHYQTGQWGIYMVGCKNVVIDGNHFWTNRPGDYGGIVLDACENVHISGGVVDDSVWRALHATPTCKNVTVEGATWARAQRTGKIVNLGRRD